MIRLHFLQQIADTPTFQLKNSARLAALQQFKCFAILQRQSQQVNFFAGSLLNDFDGLAKNRKVAKSKEIHFQQARRLDISHRPLRDDIIFSGDAAQRHVFG